MLDFSKVNKKFLAVQMTDGSKLLIRMPKKKMFETLLTLQEAMEIVNDQNTESQEAMDKLEMVYDLTAAIMSNNIGGKEITGEYLAELFDVEDIQIFFSSYMEFVGGKLSDPN